MENSVSRREFMTGATLAAGAAVAAAGAKSAFADEAAEEEETEAEEEAAEEEAESDDGEIAWDQEVDVVVCGTGTAIFAAFEAESEGATSVALIEKSSGFGGTAAYSGGAFWAPCNSHMLADGYEDNREDAIAFMKANAEGMTTDAIIEAYVDAVPEFCDWVTDYMGIELDYLSGGSLYGSESYMDYTDLEGYRAYGRTLTVSGSNVSEEATSSSYGGPLMWSLIRELVDNDDVIDLQLSTEAKHLLTNDDGRVIGVQCEQEDGTTINIKARYGVILGCGGFDFNTEWRKRYLRTPVFNTVSVSTNTGDAHRMGLEVGAALGNMQNYWGTPAMLPVEDLPEGDTLFDGSIFYNDMSSIYDAGVRRAKPNCIVVNQAGERFANESSAYHQFNRTFESWDASTFAPRNYPAYIICDATFASYYLMPGTSKSAEVGDIPEGTIVADTLEDLAEQLGIDADRLTKTVEEFNENAREGTDPQFHRGEHVFDLSTGADFTGRTDIANPCLGPVETAPFYAYGYVPGMLGTSGGLVINEKGRVLNNDDEEIPGLYACGNCTKGIFGSGYPGAGTTVAAGSVMGWIAARDAMTLDPID